jgi:hypothetical protein
MSESQYIGFRAAEKPVSDKDLEYMRQQSSRAEISPWSFDNEYHYGDFHGDVLTMLRRGYDIHLHYANFGIRKLLIRLPHNLPDAPGARAYFAEVDSSSSRTNRARAATCPSIRIMSRATRRNCGTRMRSLIGWSPCAPIFSKATCGHSILLI